MWEKKTPILVLEDCEITNFMLSECWWDIPNLELVIVKTREDALWVLQTRNDFLLAFVDWHLWKQITSTGIIQAIYQTQKWVKDIYATSSCDKARKIQITSEWATKECMKQDIIKELHTHA